jgi:hypothetical protein
MNERLKELAVQAGLITCQDIDKNDQEYFDDLERFAELVRQDERELCAKVCDLFAKSSANVSSRYEFMGESAQECANLVRARGNHGKD